MERGSFSMAAGFETLWLAASTLVFFFSCSSQKYFKNQNCKFPSLHLFVSFISYFFFFKPIIFLNHSGHKCSQGVFYTSINFLFCENMLRNYKEGNTFLLAYSNLKANDEWLTGRTRLPKQGK